MQSQMYMTPFRKLEASGQTSYVRATFGLHYIKGNSGPYMSLTGEEYSKPKAHDRYFISCGQIRETLLEVFPELSDLAKWHMAIDGEPMHYMANAMFWWEIANFVRPASSHNPGEHEQAPRHFASTVALGVLADDPTLENLIDATRPEVERILAARLEHMREAYRKVVESLPEIARKLEAQPTEV